MYFNSNSTTQNVRNSHFASFAHLGWHTETPTSNNESNLFQHLCLNISCRLRRFIVMATASFEMVSRCEWAANTKFMLLVFFPLLVIRSINFPVTESNNGGFYSLLFLSVTLSCWFFIFHFNRLTGQNETSTMNFKWMRLQLDNQLNSTKLNEGLKMKHTVCIHTLNALRRITYLPLCKRKYDWNCCPKPFQSLVEWNTQMRTFIFD